MQKSTSLKISLLTSSIILISAGQAFASEAYQAESIALDSMTRSQILSTDGDEGSFSESGIAKQAKKSIGFESITSDNVDIYAIPLSYGLPISLLGGEEYLNLSADLPYVSIEAAPKDESGLGDIRIGAEYFIEKNNIIFKGAVDLKLPTGDEDVGLGTGSTDLGISITGRKREGDIGFNATAGYILRGDAKPNGTDVDYGNVINLVGGGEYQVKPALWVGANIAFVRTGTSEFNNGFEGDGLQTIDLNPNAAYRLSSDMTVTFDIIYPLTESVVEGDLPGPDPDREMSFSFGFNSEF
jgi:hypothetical protein